MKLTNEQIKELQELESKATKNNWSIECRSLQYYTKEPYGQLPFDKIVEKILRNDTCDDGLGANIEGPSEPDRGTFVVSDAVFIAAIRNASAALLEEVLASREVIKYYADKENWFGLQDVYPNLGDKARAHLAKYTSEEEK